MILNNSFNVTTIYVSPTYGSATVATTVEICPTKTTVSRFVAIIDLHGAEFYELERSLNYLLPVRILMNL